MKRALKDNSSDLRESYSVSHILEIRGRQFCKTPRDVTCLLSQSV